MDERDTVAMAALSGFCANPELTQFVLNDSDIMAHHAYRLADAMMRARTAQCPVCKATRGESGQIIHVSGCTYGWPTG